MQQRDRHDLSKREFSVPVGVNTKRIEEFSVGAHIEFYDPYTGKKGSGTIKAFAQYANDPIVWYTDDETGDFNSVHLCWCTLTI